MHEIEVKLKFEDKISVLHKLIELNATSKSQYSLRDTYYSLEHRNMKNAQDLLRIRQKDNKTELTFKGKCENESKIWKRIELTTGVEDGKTMTEILEHLKFNKILENVSYREYWQVDDVEIAFISLKIPCELEWIEIEGPSERKVQSVLNHIKDLTKVVGEEYFKKIDEAREKSKKVE